MRSRPARSLRPAAAVAFALCAAASRSASAHEQAESFVSAGHMGSVTWPLDGSTSNLGAGVEVSLLQYTGEAFDTPGLGILSQLELLTPGDGPGLGPSHVRGALGVEGFAFFGGLEASAVIEQGDARHGATGSLQLAPYLSGAFFSIGGRIAFPLGRLASAPAYPTELGFVFTVKWPIGLDGEAFALHLFGLTPGHRHYRPKR